MTSRRTIGPLHVTRDRGEPTRPLDGVKAPPAWMDGRALCSQADPELFFADKSNVGFTRTAKAICKKCPLQAECLEWALATEQAFGVWGGLAAEDRRRLLRKKRRAA